MKIPEHMVEFVRFVIVGLIATAIHAIVYGGLTVMCTDDEPGTLFLNIAYAAGYVISLCFNYVASLCWTFRTKGSVKKGAGFLFSHFVNAGMQMGLLNLFRFLTLDKLMARALEYLMPECALTSWIVENEQILLLIPIYAIAVPVNFLMVRFFLKRA